MSRSQITGQNHCIKVPVHNKYFGNVAVFKYLGPMTVTNKNSIQEEMKIRLNLGNGFCHAIEKNEN
jgi:hypothetical protein